MKICKCCQVEKPLNEFYYANKNRETRVSNCVFCYNKKASERKKQQGEDWHKRENARKQKWADNNRDQYSKRLKDNNLKRKFGISLEDFNKMKQLQNNSCAICGDIPNVKSKNHKKPRDLAVDHCHKTGKVRGLLCFACNSSIGKLKDSTELLQRAINYLNKSRI